MIVLASLLILIPNAPLVFLMVLSSVVNGLLLPFVLIYALSLINNRSIMGDYVNQKLQNIISWATIATLTVLTLLFVFSVLFPLGASYG